MVYRTYSSPSLSRDSPDDDSYDFIVGDRIYVDGNKPGAVAYVGEVKFAMGDWAGVVLEEPLGKHNGTVHGTEYFQCEPLHGIFVRLSRLSRYPTGCGGGGGLSTTGNSSSRVHYGEPTSTFGGRSSSPLRMNHQPSNFRSSSASHYDYDSLNPSSDWYSSTNKRDATSSIWDDTENYGRSTHHSRSLSRNSYASEGYKSRTYSPDTGKSSILHKFSSSRTPTPTYEYDSEKYSSQRHQSSALAGRLSSSRANSGDRYKGSADRYGSGDRYSGYGGGDTISSRSRSRLNTIATDKDHHQSSTNPKTRFVADEHVPTYRRAPTPDSSLRLGSRVVVNSSQGVLTGILRYVGKCSFAPGEWAGVELDEPVGKNDGSVMGRRYFICMKNYGLFAPVHKVSTEYIQVRSPTPTRHYTPPSLLNKRGGGSQPGTKKPIRRPTFTTTPPCTPAKATIVPDTTTIKTTTTTKTRNIPISTPLGRYKSPLSKTKPVDIDDDFEIERLTPSSPILDNYNYSKDTSTSYSSHLIDYAETY